MAILDRSGYLNTGMRVSGAQSASRRRELLSALLSFSFWIFSFSFYFVFLLFRFSFVLVIVNENHTVITLEK